VQSRATTLALTLLALLSFAANSVITRLALGGHTMDAATFTAVRLCAGACTLVALVRWQTAAWPTFRGWRSGRGLRGPIALFGYAAPFSFAYLRIGAAVGALVLFGSVQLTMISWGVARGERPTARTWAGLGLAASGLVWLMLPSAARPDLLGTSMMVVAGVAWGVYSLAGKGAADPVAANARNFVLALPLSLGLALLTAAAGDVHTSPRGLLLAALAGGLTSGLGYAIWYRALRGLAATQAAIVQLSVPVIAGIGAVALMGETANPRLLFGALAVLGGTALALTAGQNGAKARPSATVRP
jgi:drug/metabolite transporter (DMT)-like permease